MYIVTTGKMLGHPSDQVVDVLSPSTFDVNENDIATSMGANMSSKGNVPSTSYMNNQRDLPESTSQVQPTVKRSRRPGKMLAKFNDYVIGSSVKYGLEIFALRQWNAKLTMALVENGFVQYKFDYSFYTRKYSNVFIALLTHISKNGNFKLRPYADSNWAICHVNRKFVSGYCVVLSDSLVTWKSKIATHFVTVEVEYRSMASATCEVIWLSNFLSDMGVKDLLHVVLYCDNNSALKIACHVTMLTKFDIDKFDGKISFAIWKVHMQAVLTHHGHKKALRGIAHKPQSTSVQDHLDEFNTILIDLENLDVDIDDEDKAVLLVISLPAFYKHFTEIMLYGNRETLSFDDVKYALFSKQKYDNDVEPESGEGLVARGRSSDRGKGNNEKKPENATEVAIAKGDFDGDVYLAIDIENFRDELIVDSGCTFHMIPHRSCFTTYETFNGGNVYMGNHYICPVIRMGDIQVKMHDGVVRTITGGALVLMKAIQSGGLYVLQGTVVYGTTGVATSKASLDDFKLWHYRLGYMGEKEKGKLLLLVFIERGMLLTTFILIYGGHLLLRLEEHKDEVFPTFKEWKVLIENQIGKKIKKLRTDNGLEFCGESINALCRKYGIARHHTLVRTPQQNGVAERMNRTIMEKVRCNFIDYSNLRVFGCPVYVHVNEGKLVSRAVKCIFLGYGSGVKVHIENCEPKNYLEAISSPECDKWVVAMEGEVESLQKNKTCELVKLSKEKRIISCKWLFKVKDGIAGVESNQYKAHYVVRFDQRDGIDFNEVFPPVVLHTSIRVLLSIVALQDLELEQLDVKTVFLHGYLKEEIYVEQPEDGSFLYLVLYVDDMLIDAPNKDQIRELKDQLSNEFDMKDLGAAKRILGMEIQRDKKIGKLTLSQTDYILKVLKKFNTSSCKPIPTPLAPHFKLSYHECPKSKEDKKDMSRVPYSSSVSSLMYAMVCTRLDLAHAVSVVSRYMHNPGRPVLGYVDFDYAGYLDARKSLCSYIFSHCGSAISWYSSLQAITALSTTEAEYISSTEGVKEAIWL
uniref:Retrovirus-related Pol polyprotein from transposon TNT 1-94 n=1 Tax=Tanacetum cinerariifolium TaxID=118510 RepID=A0A6L2L0K2_TANCI|nr:retrovirus-related Pol polyprotein from transposon TNT 1-94 [Tanacetum cinerariifolium]